MRTFETVYPVSTSALPNSDAGGKMLRMPSDSSQQKRGANHDLRFERRPKMSVGERMAVLVFGDLLLLFASLALALWVWNLSFQKEFSLAFLLSQKYLLLLMAPWLLLSLISDSYNPNNMKDLPQSLKFPFLLAFLACLTYMVAYFFTRREVLPRAVALYFAAISCSALTLWRLAHHSLFGQRCFRERIAIVGSGESASVLEKLLEQNRRLYENVASLSAESADPECQIETGVRELGIDRVVFTTADSVSLALRCLIRLRQAGIPVTSMLRFHELLTGRTPLSQMEERDQILLLIKEEEGLGLYPFFKRVADVACALVGLSLFAVLFPAIAAAIKFDSRGSMFFSQVRVGKNGRRFRVWKLRTMVEGAERQGATWTEKRDIRITRVGKWIRKTHLDEFPQFWNLLRGDVSLVGVRPLAVLQCEQFARRIPFHDLRHLVKPGLTGWAVVNYNYVNDLEGAKTRLEYDIYYLTHQSFLLDLYIILRTFWIMVTLKGL